MDERAVVTCFLRHEGAVLLLRRSEAVGSYRGQWGGVAGHAEGDPAAAARQEIREETGLDPDRDVTLVRRGEPFTVEDDERGTRWVVHPFLFDAATREVTVDWETAAYEWVAPTAILHRETVPDLWTSYDRVRPTVDTVASDREHGAAYISVRALEVLRDEAALVAVDGNDTDGGWSRVAETARALLAARPSMSVVRNRVNCVMHVASEARTASAVEHTAATAIEQAVTADRRAAECAAERIAGQRVATFSRSGTVLTALEPGHPEAVLVAESNPGREGVDVAERLAGSTDVTLAGDAGLAHALAEWDADALLVGADTVLADGRVVNKVGTRGAAIAASFEGIDVYVVAAADKLSPDGHIDLEPRAPEELYDGEAALTVLNPTFDVTPPDCIDAVVTERGVLDAPAVKELAGQHRSHADWE
ncbi:MULTISPECIES: NUDIX domain-containing protein [Salinibaculum]|uniref:NUDIX domain-containing protein n=1 Tax=Salinibaculum TaxID=2732368 RepID=UPI0030CAA647